MLAALHQAQADIAPSMLKQVQEAAISNANVFTAIMEATKYCSLGQITKAMYEVGGQYRRNM